jgi:hypothetical protein
MRIAFAVFGAVLFATAAVAQPFADSSSSPPVGKAYVYKVKGTGGTGTEIYTLAAPPNGDYMVSFDASFAPQGSTASPNKFACWLTANGTQFAAASAADLGGYWDIALSAQAPLAVTSGMTIQVSCDNEISTPWRYDEVPLKVTFVKLAGKTSGKITASDSISSNAALGAGHR